MADKTRKQQGQGKNRDKGAESIGNQQRTAQTGGQNAGGTNQKQEDDKYTEDLRQSGNRTSSNRRNESERGR